MGVSSGLSDDLGRALTRAWHAWNREQITGTKYVYFNDLVKDKYGIQLYKQLGIDNYTGYDIVDEQKFAMFLLKWS